jgi:putative peptidoglycan lipid II flippase
MTFSQLINSQAKTIAFAAGLLVFSSLVSRVLGIARNGLLSWRFGAGETTDIYLAAFRIPDFIYGIFIMGGISVVFLPLFSEYVQKNEKEAWEFTNNLLHVLIGVVLLLSIAAFVLSPWLMEVVAPGFSPEQKAAAAGLSRLMLLSPLLLGVSSVFSGVLQYFGKFAAYSLAPILYNVGIIAGILFLVPLFGIWGLGLGVVTGAFLHLVIQVPAALRSGFHWQPILRIGDPSIKRVVQLALPRTVAAAGFHINLVVVTALASVISTGSITIFNYANDIQYFPIGLVGISFALASFPALSRFFAEKDTQGFLNAFSLTFRQVAFFVVPIAALIFLLRAQIIRLVYGTGTQFLWDDTRLTAAVLGIFAFGILFQAFIPLLARVFFAVHDTKTPTAISLGSVILNILLAVLFMKALSMSPFVEVFQNALKLQGIEDIRVLALPLALVISGAFHALFLLTFLRKHIRGTLTGELILSLAKTGIASLTLALTTYAILQVYGGVFELRTYQEVLGQLVLASFGGVLVFMAISFLLRSPEMIYFWNAIKGKIYGR